MLLSGKNPHGGDIYANKIEYDFSVNTSPLGIPDEVKKCAAGLMDELSSYPDPYCTELRSALAAHHNTVPGRIICGNGAAELIYAFAMAVKPKSACIISPTFSEYEKSLRNPDCEISYRFDDNQTYDVIYVCNPNNPTGTAMSKTDVLKLRANCRILFVDECFMDLCNTPELYSVIDTYSENLFVLKAFTKTYGMAGIRLGYGISSNSALLEDMCGVLQTWNVSAIAQKCGIEALKCHGFVRESREIVQAERRYLTDSLRKLGFEVYDSKVNFILFISNTNLYENLLKKHILIRKCGNFFGLDDTYYRCAVRKHEDNVIFINTVREIIEHGKS